MEIVLALIVVQLLVLWQLTRRQPIVINVYIVDKAKAPDRVEGDEWKDQ